MSDVQTFADILVLGMRDDTVIDTIKYHLDAGGKHGEVAMCLIQALDNMYGVGSYFRCVRTGVLPSNQ